MASSASPCNERSNGAGSDECCGRSTAQMRLEKILQIISSGSRNFYGDNVFTGTNRCVGCFESGSSGSAMQAKNFFSGFGADPNLRLGPLSESAGPEEPEAAGRDTSVSGGDGGEGREGGETAMENARSIEEKSYSVLVEKKILKGECDRDEAATVSKASSIVKEEGNTGEDLTGKEALVCSGKRAGNDSVSQRNGCEDSEDGGEAHRDPVTPPEVERPPLGIIYGEEAEEDGTTHLTRRVQDHHDGFLHLLVEAARLLSANFGENEEEEEREVPASKTSTTKKDVNEEKGGEVGRDGGGEGAAAGRERGPARRKRRFWMLEYCGAFEEDTEPVVRSKRGRNQVLPSRFRDSVIEPWRAGPTATRPPRPRR